MGDKRLRKFRNRLWHIDRRAALTGRLSIMNKPGNRLGAFLILFLPPGASDRRGSRCGYSQQAGTAQR